MAKQKKADFQKALNIIAGIVEGRSGKRSIKLLLASFGELAESL